jgi:hypothetical protein
MRPLRVDTAPYAWKTAKACTSAKRERRLELIPPSQVNPVAAYAHRAADIRRRAGEIVGDE